jgi:hypothetical protein
MNHRWPCSSGTSGRPRIPLAEVPFVTLERCGYCGALWTCADRSIHRVTVDVAEATFGITIPVFDWAHLANESLTEPTPVRAIYAQLNGDALFRLVLSTDDASRVVRERGAILPSETLSTEELTPLDADAAVELVEATWGASAAAVLRLALETDLDPSVLRALDHIQALPVEEWGIAWQPRATAFAHVLRQNGPDPSARIRAALDAAIAEGVTSTRDLRAAGLID